MIGPFDDTIPDPGDDWKAKAPCRSAPAEWFYIEEGGDESTLRGWALCNSCPLAKECLATALRDQERFGLFGRMSAQQREILLAGFERQLIRWTDVAAML